VLERHDLQNEVPLREFASCDSECSRRSEESLETDPHELTELYPAGTLAHAEIFVRQSNGTGKVSLHSLQSSPVIGIDKALAANRPILML